jgi:anti-sigma B factor antagonist
MDFLAGECSFDITVDALRLQGFDSINYRVTDMGFKERSRSIVLLPQSRLDLQGGSRLQQQFAAIAPEHHSFWIVDMSTVDFIDSAGLVALVSGLTLARQKQCRLAVCNVTSPVRLILEISQLDRVFEIHDTLEAALGSVVSLPEPLPLVSAELAVA